MRFVPALVLIACGAPYVTLSVEVDGGGGYADGLSIAASEPRAMPAMPEGGLADGGFYWFPHPGDTLMVRRDAEVNWLLVEKLSLASRDPTCTGSVEMNGDDLTISVAYDPAADVCAVTYLRPNATK